MAPKRYCFDLSTVAMVAFVAYDANLSTSFIIHSYVCTDTHIQSQRKSHTKIWPDRWNTQMCSFALETVLSPKTNQILAISTNLFDKYEGWSCKEGK